MKDKLTILWTNGDPITAELMVFMYAKASLRNDWWSQVHLIIWGAPTKLIAENPDMQKKLKEVQEAGVHVEFCLACARELGVDKQIEALGYPLNYMGQPLTEIIKEKGELITI